MKQSSLMKLIERVKESVLVLVGNVNKVAANNLLLYVPYAEEISSDFHSDIEQVLKSIVGIYKEKISRFIFYCWFDEMAGQIRCSVIPSDSKLSFNGPYITTHDFNPIVQRALSRWSEIYGLLLEAPDECAELSVYVIVIK